MSESTTMESRSPGWYATRADAAVPDNRFIESTNLFVHCAAIIKKTSIDEESSLHRERAGYFAQRVALSTSPQIRAPRLLYFELIDSSDQYVAEARELIRLGWQSDQPIAGLYVHGERDAARQLARASDEIDSRIANAYLEFDNPLRRQEIREDYEEVISQTREPNTILNAIQMLILLGDDGRARSEAQRLLSSVVSYDQNMLRERLEFIAATSPSAKQLVLAAGDSRYKRAVVEYQLGVICLGGHDRIGATLHFRESIRLNDFLTPYSHWTRVFLEKIDEPQN